MELALVVMLAPLVLAVSMAIMAVASPSGSDQFVARSAIWIVNTAPAMRVTVKSPAIGGWLLVKTTFSDPLWRRNWPPARSLLKLPVAIVNAAGSKFVTLSVVEATVQ